MKTRAYSESVTSTIASRDSLEITEVDTKPSTDAKRKSSVSSTSSPTKDRTSSDWNGGILRTPSRRTTTRSAGLDEMAAFMMGSRGRSGTLLRRFEKVNLKGLLEMEREIGGLEAKIEGFAESGRGDEEEVREMEEELRGRVREYYEAMLLTKEIMALSRPHKRTLDESRRAFPPEFGQSLHILSKYHDPDHEDDLSSLAPPLNPDPLTRILEKLAAGRNVTHILSFLSAMCAVLFLVGAMVGLYFVSNMRARLGLVGMFTVLFAVTIAALTHTRRQDVFVATAAYAAVLVVFVSGNIAANPQPTTCNFQTGDGNSNANAAALNSATPIYSAAAVTVTAYNVQTVTSIETGTMRTVFSTLVSVVTTTPTVIIKKGELSSFAKTGIGVGAAIGALFCLMLIGGMVVWMRQRKWVGEGGVFSVFGLGVRKEKEERNQHMGWWEKRQVAERKKMDAKGSIEKGGENGNAKGKVKVGMQETKDGQVVWV